MAKPIRLIILALLVSLLGCGKTAMETTSGVNVSYLSSNSSLYFKTSKRVVVEVYFEPGAEPFTGLTPNGMAYWKILEDNLNAIFKYRTTLPVVVVPKELSEMILLPAQNKTKWTIDDIVKLGVDHTQALPTETEARFYVYFVKGNSEKSNTVIAESIDGTPIIAVYKSVIIASGGPVVQRYVEQSTIVHELGHALGFVNNGVPMKTPYQDTAHGNHSTNPDCVMYWLNEGSTDMIGFVQKLITTGNTVMWGPEVLEDAKAYSK